MNTMTEAMSRKIEERAADIKGYVGMGWSLEDAVAAVKKSSTLGPKSWERIMEIVAASR